MLETVNKKVKKEGRGCPSRSPKPQTSASWKEAAAHSPGRQTDGCRDGPRGSAGGHRGGLGCPAQGGSGGSFFSVRAPDASCLPPLTSLPLQRWVLGRGGGLLADPREPTPASLRPVLLWGSRSPTFQILLPPFLKEGIVTVSKLPRSGTEAGPGSSGGGMHAGVGIPLKWLAITAHFC